MTTPNLNILVSLNPGEEATEQEADRLTRRLQKSLIAAGADVNRAQSDETLPGAKGIPIDINTLVVTLGSAGVLTAVIQLLKDWVLRAEGRTIKLRAELDGKAIEVEYTPTAISEAELMAFADKLMHQLDKFSSQQTTGK
ncbi:MAG: hypothetical protein D6768_08070 [Chloroflexi bacterium]|nr:MAG: hypothetical protein D6768_08070 [Chloroflexota bacterium]